MIAQRPSVGRIVIYRADVVKTRARDTSPGPVHDPGGVPVIWPAIITAVHEPEPVTGEGATAPGWTSVDLTAFPPAADAVHYANGMAAVAIADVPQADEARLVVDDEPQPVHSWRWPPRT